MARIDRMDMPASAASQARDPIRSNEQAWRKAMDGALFELLQRDPEAARNDTPSQPRPQTVGHKPVANGDAQQQPTAKDSTAPSLDSTNPVANAPVSMMRSMSRTQPESTGDADVRPPASVNALAQELAPSHAVAAPSGTGTTPREPVTPPLSPVTAGAASLLPGAAPGFMADDCAAAPEHHEPAARRNDEPLSVPAERHVFLEHTAEGAVLWMRDARGDVATLSPSLKFLLAESARQGVKVTGVRLNGRALAWPELNSIPHSDHPQGEDHGR
jgi:hypothetical protein